MSEIPDINLQAMSVMAYAVNNDAANIANLNTPGYQRRETVITSGPGRVDAVTETTVPWGQGGPPVPSEIANDDETQRQARDAALQTVNADFTRDMVNLMIHERGFQVNAAVVRGVEETTGTLLDAFA
ncbi:flagellar basal body rod C-terminal domain-containing protein [Fundidesulfovibrio butyratiphilus]